MRKTLTAAAIAAALLVPAVPASAAPSLDPCLRDPTECDPLVLGPGGDRDYFCVWSWPVGREVCSYQPGNGRTSGKLLVEWRWPWE